MATTELVMPKMSMTMTEGEVVEILVAIGDQVTAGQVVAVVGTDKTDMEVESDHTGTVTELPAKPGDVLEVGAALIVLQTEGEDLLAGLFGDSASQPEQATVSPVVTDVVVEAATQPPAAQAEVMAMPGARKLAREQGIDLTQVVAASASGVIKQSDLGTGATVSASDDKKRRARLMTAKVVATALDIPQFSLTKSIELSSQLPENAADRAVALLTAWSRTLQELHVINQQFVDGDFREVSQVRAAVLTQTELGFVSPVISLTGSWQEKAGAVLADARNNKIALENLAVATTSVTDLSEFGISQANTLLFGSQSSGINIGNISLVGGIVTIDVTIVLDHRIADPGDGAKALDLFGRGLNEVLVG
jgi:pyruvate dehydrogenase E2 component (dihydrolipoamide acetyltransferase)